MREYAKTSTDISKGQKDAITKQSNIIYWFKSGKIEFDDEYMGESARTFEEHYKEHLKAPSPIIEHQNTTDYTISVDNFKIIGRKGHNMARAIKSNIYYSQQVYP